MEDRIQLNGEWYVREQPDAELEAVLHPFRKEIKPLKREDVTAFKGFVYETDKFCYEVTIIAKDGLFEEGEYHDNIDIKFTDKRIKPWVEDHWDSMFWFKGVLENNPESVKELLIGDRMDREDIDGFRSFLAFLKQQGWL
jgi:uncharacterized protein YegJ (DUF2314 family)